MKQITYYEDLFQDTNSRINQLDKYYFRYPNVYSKYQRLLLKYQYVCSNINLILSYSFFNQLLNRMFSNIPKLKRDLFSSHLSHSVKHRISKKLNMFSKIYYRANKEQINKVVNYQLYWEHVFIKKLSKLFDNLSKMNVDNKNCHIKQGHQISYIYQYIEKRIYLTLNNPRFYQLINVSIERINVLKEQSLILPIKQKKKMRSRFKSYMNTIQSWKWYRYLCIWFSKQIPILNEHQQIVVEFLFPRIKL